MVMDKTRLPFNDIRNSLLVLMQQNIVQYKVTTRLISSSLHLFTHPPHSTLQGREVDQDGTLVAEERYTLEIEALLVRLRFSRFVDHIYCYYEREYGDSGIADAAKSILSELTVHGRLSTIEAQSQALKELERLYRDSNEGTVLPLFFLLPELHCHEKSRLDLCLPHPHVYFIFASHAYPYPYP